MDAEHIGEYMQTHFDSTETGAEFRISDPIEGDQFDFEALGDTDYLIVSTSSCLGFPPSNFIDFSHQLKLAAATNPGCLDHMRHTVWGNGDERWRTTYMSMPRYVDRLLEECGSTRFYARGESGEPHAPTGADGCSVEEWTTGAWEAMLESGREDKTNRALAVSWDALWDYQSSRIHCDVTEWGLQDLVRQSRRYVLPGGPSSFAAVGSEHGKMMADLRAEEEEKFRLYQEQMQARRNK